MSRGLDPQFAKEMNLKTRIALLPLSLRKVITNNLPSEMLENECFSCDTLISTKNNIKGISEILIGDLIFAFDPSGDSDSGRGKLVEKRVTKLYRNVTREWIELDLGETDPETGAAKTLTCTPGHHFLDEFGQFPTIAEMLLRGGGVARLVMEDGSIRAARGRRIVWSEETAHLYGSRANQAGWTDGSVALAETEVDGWQHGIERHQE